MWDRITKNLRKEAAINFKSTGTPLRQPFCVGSYSSWQHDSAFFLHQLNLVLLHEKIIYWYFYLMPFHLQLQLFLPVPPAVHNFFLIKLILNFKTISYKFSYCHLICCLIEEPNIGELKNGTTVVITSVKILNSVQTKWFLTENISTEKIQRGQMLCCFPWSIQVTLLSTNMKKCCWERKVIQTSRKDQSLSFATETPKYISAALERNPTTDLFCVICR